MSKTKRKRYAADFNPRVVLKPLKKSIDNRKNRSTVQ